MRPGFLDLVCPASGWGWFLTQLAAGSRVSQSWCWPADEWSWIMKWLAEESKVSQSCCWPASGWGWGPEDPRAGISLLVDMVRAQGVQR